MKVCSFSEHIRLLTPVADAYSIIFVGLDAHSAHCDLYCNCDEWHDEQFEQRQYAQNLCQDNYDFVLAQKDNSVYTI